MRITQTSYFPDDSKVMRSMADDFSGVEFLKAEDVAQGILWTSLSPTG